MIDADPNQPLQDWFELSGKPENIVIYSDINENNVIDVINAARKKHKYVIVDLEGTASAMVGYAISRADLVLIPLQGSQLDAKQAINAVNLIRRNEQAFEREIPYTMVFTRTNAAIQGRTYKHIFSELSGAEIDILESQLLDREAFRALFSLGGTVYDLSPKDVSNLEAAKENSNALIFDVLQRLTKNSKQTKQPKKSKRRAA